MSPRIRSLVVLVTGLVGIELAAPPPAQADELMPGHLEGEGTHFEVSDSEYLNLTADSSELIWLRIDSIPGLVTIEVESAGAALATVLTLSGLAPSTTYYAYEDDFHNGSALVTDELGSCSFAQDLTVAHRLIIQPTPSTHFIPSDLDIGTWDPDNRVYTLTTDVSETIQIDENNLTLDGVGHTIIGSGSGYGVYLVSKHDVTIENLHVEGFANGMDVTGAAITLRANDVRNNTYGITAKGTVLLEDNIAANNARYGILLSWSFYGTATGNTMLGNAWNLGINAPHPSIQIDTTNTIDGRPVYYVVNAPVGSVFDASTNAGAFYAVDCDGITIRDLTPTNTGQGVCLRNTHNSTIDNVTAVSNAVGINLSASTGNAVINNSISNSIAAPSSGIYLRASSNANVVADNTVLDANNGIVVYGSDANDVIGNTIAGGGSAIVLFDCTGNVVADGAIESNHTGIYMLDAYANTVVGNTVSDCATFALSADQSSGNTIIENTLNFLDGNLRALRLGATCEQNLIYNNNFVGDTYYTKVIDLGTGNLFSLPAPIGGNYWSDWTGPDADADGFVDLPYVFDGGQDDLPWATPDGWIQDPAELIAKLIDHVLSLNLQHGIENSLDSKLDAALQAIEDVNDNNNVAAANALQAFINAVQAQSGNHIPELDALDLEIEALEIIDLLLSG